MASRRDQVQSYQFFVQRMTSALVARDPDPANAPFRRLGGAGLGGIMVAVIFLAAVGVYGLIRPGGATRWKEGGSVILEKETGTRYLYRDGELHPVLNYASALLALEAPAATVSVSRNSLVGVPRGSRLGIPYAPDSLPDPGRMLSGPWTLCSQPARNEANELVATTVLTVGRPPTGGRSPDAAALLVKDEKNNRLYLVWHDHRYLINDATTVLEALTLASEHPHPVGAAWLNALPAGEPIGTIAVSGRGTPSSALRDALTGQVFVVQSQDGSRQYYLAQRSNLLPITPLQADVVLADPATRAAYPGVRTLKATQLNADTAAAAPKAAQSDKGAARAPEQRPQIAPLTGDRPAVCARYEPGQNEPTVLLDAQVRPVKEPVRTPEQSATGIPLADRVVVEPGYGVLVSSKPSPGAPTGTLNLVTDLGYRYPLSDAAVAGVLGYGDVEPVQLPASLVVRLPSGPALDPTAAKRALDPE
ncbi:type VII secretion protein EccB [Plantactinospora sp. KBS50]|uniref:type VII secretion protein EccB n=1 Tax=Plantactinospora sp. KBS50 TaxID=2024580 RepID=UPI000BAAB13B|nr:type VII secretion protein EccB [Plantactinospora sp. KBS50]ASW57115.1 type VII secretion protein EccB [Plantactinospora sp. KBS50]